MNPSQLKIETPDIPKPGGQYVGLTEPRVLVTHIGTGLSVKCAIGRSQRQCIQIATEMLEYGLLSAGWSKEELEREG